MVCFINAVIIEHEGEEWHVRPERIDDHDYVVVCASDKMLSKLATGSHNGARNSTFFDELKKLRNEALLDLAIPPPLKETDKQKKRRLILAKQQLTGMSNANAIPTEVDVTLPAILKDGNEVAAATCLHLIAEVDGRSQLKVRLEKPAVQYIIAALRMEDNYRPPRPKRDICDEMDGQWKVTWALDRSAYVARAGAKCRTFRPGQGCDRATMHDRAMEWVRGELGTMADSITDLDELAAEESQATSSAY